MLYIKLSKILHRLIFSLGTLIIGFVLNFTYPSQTHAAGSSHDMDLTITGTAGYRRDQLDWNIANDITGTTTPNILSELTWSNLEIIEHKAGGEFLFNFGLYLEGSLAYGIIYRGDNRDSDYTGDNRTNEFSRSENDSNGDNTFDLKYGVGYTWKLGGGFSITPLLGYSYHEQNLRMTNGNQVIPASGTFFGLNSTYQTQWDGLWTGVLINYKWKITTFKLRGEYHRADYYAEANWNLRTDFAHPKSFDHRANGTGDVINFSVAIDLTKHWKLETVYMYQKWQTDPGVDTVYFSDGTIAVTRLNEVNWQSRAFHVGVSYVFNI